MGSGDPRLSFGEELCKPHTPDHQPVKNLSLEHLPVHIDLDGCNVGFKHWHPTPVTQNGNKLAGQGEFGGVWEWTSSPLKPHPGFKAMDIYPGYTGEYPINCCPRACGCLCGANKFGKPISLMANITSCLEVLGRLIRGLLVALHCKQFPCFEIE